MRTPKHISPSSLSIWLRNQKEYYLSYLSDMRPPKIPQTAPMAVGSAFDAYAKSYLHEALFGKNNDPKFELLALFEAQVEPHNRDACWEIGKEVFRKYRATGAVADLMVELQRSIGKPKFEIEVKGVVNGVREGIENKVGGVILLGKPDLFYVNHRGMHVEFDWKTTGYYSNSHVSPMKGYVKLRPGGKTHKDAFLMNYEGVTINGAETLDIINEDWARQLSIYSWLCGIDVGSPFVAAIDQIICSGELRVAEHRLKISKKFQEDTLAQAQELWNRIHSDWFFREMTKEESAAQCKLLDGVGEALSGDGSDSDKWFSSNTRG